MNHEQPPHFDASTNLSGLVRRTRNNLADWIRADDARLPTEPMNSSNSDSGSLNQTPGGTTGFDGSVSGCGERVRYQSTSEAPAASPHSSPHQSGQPNEAPPNGLVRVEDVQSEEAQLKILTELAAVVTAGVIALLLWLFSLPI